MPKVDVYDIKGKKVSDVELSEKVFGIEPNENIVHEVLVNYLANQRQGTQSTKTRAEVRGGGRKPWRQKGTGRARQGSIRAPQWVGGGTVFGPTPRSYEFKLNRKVKQLALKNTLTYKLNEKSLTVVEGLKLDAIKTKDFVKFLADVKAEGKTIVVCAPEEFSDVVYRSSANVAGAFYTTTNKASVYEILCYKNLVLTEAAVAYYEKELN